MLRDRAAFSRQPLPIEEAWLWSPTRRLPTAVVWQQPLRQILSRVYLALAAPGRLNNRNDPCQLFLTWNLYLDLQAAGTNILGERGYYCSTQRFIYMLSLSLAPKP